MFKMADANSPCEPVYYSTNRGGTKMELNGFVYNKDRSSDSKPKVYWRCEDRTCNGRVVRQSNNPVQMTSLSGNIL